MRSTTEPASIASIAPAKPLRHRGRFWRNAGNHSLKRSIVVAAGLGVAAALSISTPASADPKNEPFEIVCDNGTTYWATDNGYGQFAPVHDVDSNSMLIPTSFGDFHGVITDSTGAVVEEFTDPPVAKGSSTKPRATSVSCTYVVSGEFDIPGIGPVTVTGTGTVEALLTPVR
jgi:hypothetical protein